MIELPNKKKCYNLPEQVAQNLRNIEFLAEQYKNIDALPAIWKTYKEEFDSELETFGEWTTTFEGWTETLSTYLANMSSAAVGAIAGQNIAPANIAATGNITAPSIIENMSGYSFNKGTTGNVTYDFLYAGVVKNGNKITMVVYAGITRTDTVAGDRISLGSFDLPQAIRDKLFPAVNDWLTFDNIYCGSNYASGVSLPALCIKEPGGCSFNLYNASNLVLNTKYYVRFEKTFLLSDNLAA